MAESIEYRTIILLKKLRILQETNYDRFNILPLITGILESRMDDIVSGGFLTLNEIIILEDHFNDIK